MSINFYPYFRIAIAIITSFLFLSAELTGQVSGTVFRDLDGDGIKTSNAPGLNEQGVGGVLINAYSTDNAIIASYVSNADGTYFIPAVGGAYSGILGSNSGTVVAGTSVRVEFEIPEAVAISCGLDPAGDFTGYNGSVYGSSVQFVSGGAEQINFAIQSPGLFRQNDDPTVFIPCFVNGDPLGGGDSGTAEWFVAFPYSNSGTQMPSDKLNGVILGSVHGVAYSKQAKKVFTSAFLKRHSGLGVLGTGGIYTIAYNQDGTFGAIAPFYDLDANGYPTRYNGSKGALPYGNGSSFSVSDAPMNNETIVYLGDIDDESGQPAGLGVIGTNVERGLSPSKDVESYDPAAFDQVGKVGLGDMAISDDGRFLFITNLYCRTVLRLELNNPYNPTAVIDVVSYPIPDIACNDGLLRPFGLKFHKGNLYVGTVCSGENGGQNIINGATDLYAQVLQIEDAAGQAVWTQEPIVDFPLNYRKGTSYTLGGCGGFSRWKPWTNTFQTTCNLLNFRMVWEQPMLADIEFADDGAMILGFMDRMGHMAGGGNVDLIAAEDEGDDPDLWYVSTGGDILKAFREESEDCGYRIENAQDRNAQQNNNQGPNGGEFFYHDFYDNHHETAQGGLLWLPGTGEVASTVMDPIAINSGGLKWLNTSTGETNKNFQLYAGVGQVGLLGKANGLGAMDFSRDLPPLEIGNRVWMDSNRNGIQDADEEGIDGLSLSIFRNGTLVGETITSNGGHYYFNNENVTINSAEGLLPNTVYEIRLSVGQQQLSGLELTEALVSSPGMSHVRDSDAELVNGFAVIVYQTGSEGENDHTLDIGFAPMMQCPELIIPPGNVVITDAFCSDCVFEDGTIEAPENACPTGSFVQYSTDDGETWTVELPIYNAEIIQTIITRCVCEMDESIISPSSGPISTAPEQCPVFCVCPEFPDAPDNVLIQDSDCLDCVFQEGVIFAPSAPCPQGSTLQYTVDNGVTWTTTLPIYDQDNVITISTRCACDADPAVVSEVSSPVSTNPQVCPPSCDPIICFVSILGAVPSDCDPFTNTYDLDVTVTYTASQEGTISINGVDFDLPAGELLTQTFQITGLSANGATGVNVTAIVTIGDETCEDTLTSGYNAPESCEVDLCMISIISAVPSTCEPFTSTYSLDVTVMYTIEEDGTFTINGQSFPVTAGEGITQTFTLVDLDANGQEGVTILLSYSENQSCSASLEEAYDAPDACEPTCPGDYEIFEEDLTIDVLSVYTIPVCLDMMNVSITIEIENPCEFFFDPANLSPDFGGLNFVVSSVGDDFITYTVTLVPGTYTWVFTYTNPNGEMISVSTEITVDTEINEPAVISMPSISTFQLSYCAEAIETFTVSIVDDCDDPIDTDRAFFTLCGATINWTNFDPLTGTFTFAVPVNVDLDGCLFTATYTDSAGNVSTSSTTITVIGTEDETAPVIVYPSQDVYLEYGICDEAQIYCFYVTAVDDCDGDVTPIVTINGSVILPIAGTNSYCIEVSEEGDFEVVITATDSNGNVRIERFNIIITEVGVPSVSLACINQINVSLNSDCAVILQPSMVLSGSFGCLGPDDFVIRVLDGAIELSQPLQECGLFIYEISLAPGVDADFNTCWGYVLVEDKTPPILNVTCPGSSSVQDCTCEISCLSLADLLAASSPEDLNALGICDPIVSDNCEVTWSFEIGGLITGANCFDTFVEILYTAEDLCGNTTSATRLIRILYNALETVCDRIENYDGTDQPAISCIDSRLSSTMPGPWLDASGNPSPNWTGSPADETCNLHCAYTDINIPLCGLDGDSDDPFTPRKILRTWTCVDWCAAESGNQQVATCYQIIKIMDGTLPVIQTLEPLIYAQHPYDCNYSFVFRNPIVTDDCSAVQYTGLSINGGPFIEFTGNIYPLTGTYTVPLSEGVLTVTYRAEDQCGNRAEDVTVVYPLTDRNPPVAVCETFRVVSLGSNCKARIFADAFDDGSHDNGCEIASREVRRMPILNGSGNPTASLNPGHTCYEGNTTNEQMAAYVRWGGYVDFCCVDLISSSLDERMVEFRVIDQGGNSNTCMVVVEIQDKLIPSGVKPPDMTINCEDPILHWDFTNISAEQKEILNDFFGRVIVESPSEGNTARRLVAGNINTERIVEVQVGFNFLDGRAWDNCAGTACFTITDNVRYEGSTCGSGSLIRTWVLQDGAGNSVTLTQTISVDNFYPFMGGAGRRAYSAIGYYTTFMQSSNPVGEDPTTWPMFRPLNGNEGFANGQSEAGAQRSRFRAVAPGQSATSLFSAAANGYPSRFDLVWPADLSIDLCAQELDPVSLASNPLYRTGARPYIWRDNACSNIGVTFDEWSFDFEAGCRKIVRKWKVIDWCQTPSLISPWTWDQIIKIVDTDGPDITSIEAFINSNQPNTSVSVACGGETTFEFFDACEGDKSVRFVITGTDPCAVAADADAVRWDWEVTTASGTLIRRRDLPGEQNFTPRGDTYVLERSFERTLPGGNPHILKIITEDGCGNKSTCLVNFRIEDRKKPTPIAFSSLSTEVMPEGPNAGEVAVQALLFNNGSSDNCTATNFRLGQFTQAGQDVYTSGPRHLRTPVSTYQSLVFTCKCPEVLPAGIADCDALRAPNASSLRLVHPGEVIELSFWVGDEYGNWDYTTVQVRIDNNMGADCDEPDMGDLAGQITTILGDGVEFVNVESVQFDMTSLEGFYHMNLPLYRSYSLRPIRNDHPRNGVNVADILAIQRHILGEARIDNPYNLIAADVNDDKIISTQDLIQIRRLLLGIHDGFPGINSWRFIPKDYEFQDPLNAHAEQFPEEIFVEWLSSDMMNNDFYGVKVGDVNNTVLANSQSLTGSTSRSQPLTFIAKDATLKIGEEHTVTLSLDSRDQVEGYQFTFEYDPTLVTFVGLHPIHEAIRPDHFGLKMTENGMITMVWYGMDNSGQFGSLDLFSLTFRARRDIELSQALQIGSGFTEAMAVVNGVIRPVVLNFENSVGTASYELYQNQPNPFDTETLISFELPSAMSASLTIFDVTGRVVKIVDGDFGKGKNDILIKRIDLPASGVMFYQITAGEYRATKKMILLE